MARELMYMPVANGGQDVVRVPLKLDVLYSSLACRVLVQRAAHKCFYFVPLYQAFALQHVVPTSNAVPRAEVLTPA